MFNKIKNLYFKKNKKQSPLKFVEESIAQNPNLEHSFIKKPTKKIQETTKESGKNHVIIDLEKVKQYNLKNPKGKQITIHNHSKQNGSTYILPSIVDILNMHRNVIYINDGKNIIGQVHFRISKNKNNYAKLLLEINAQEKRISKYMDLNNKDFNNLIREYYTSFLELKITDLLLKTKEGKEYLKNKTKSIEDSSSTKIFSYIVKNLKISSKESLNNYLKLRHLFNSEKHILEIYDLLGIKIRFVPNKNKGYIFDKDKLDFIQK